MRIDSTKNFLKAYGKLSKKRRDAVDSAILLFQKNREAPSLRDHALKGKMKGLRSFSAGGDLRVIYREEGNFLVVILIDTGSHNQVYS